MIDNIDIIGPMPDFLRATPEKAARAAEAVRVLNSKERAVRRRAYRRAINKASKLIERRREFGRKTSGQCRALERLGYTRYAMNRLTRGEADTVIAAKRAYQRGKGNARDS